MKYKIMLIFTVLIIAVGINGCIEIGQITASLSSKSPFQVSENETITITASVSNSPVSEATVKISYVGYNQNIVIDDAFMSNMNVIGKTDISGSVQYTVPTGVAGKKMIYVAEKPSTLNKPGFGIADII